VLKLTACAIGCSLSGRCRVKRWRGTSPIRARTIGYTLHCRSIWVPSQLPYLFGMGMPFRHGAMILMASCVHLNVWHVDMKPCSTGSRLEQMRTLCTLNADLSGLRGSLKRLMGSEGPYYRVDYEVVVRFGGTQLQATIQWKEGVRIEVDCKMWTMAQHYTRKHVVKALLPSFQMRSFEKLV
jgi:hypothetical protein